MKKAELKNRLRRRTADKLHDLARSAGRMPTHLPEDAPATTCELALRRRKARRKSQPDRVPAR
jgi:hypothetical protein